LGLGISGEDRELLQLAQHGRLGELEALLDGLGEEGLEEADEGLQGKDED